MTDKNRDSLSFYGGNPSDISLNHWQYHDFIDHLLDDRLTAEGLMKLKRLHSSMSMNAVVIPIAMFPLAWVANRWMTNFIDRGLTNSRYNLMGMGIFYPLFLYWGFTRPIPRKLYSDLICDNGADGAYIREVLRTRKPGLWQNVSKQLFENNFNFPEMNERSNTEFGGGFVSHRIY